MIKNIINLNIVSTEKKIFGGFVRKIQISGSEGEMGILPGHTPLLSNIKPGFIKLVDVNYNTEYIYLSGGIIEVQPFKVIVLADVAFFTKDINKEEVLKTKYNCIKSLQNLNINNKKISSILLELNKAIAQLYILKLSINK